MKAGYKYILTFTVVVGSYESTTFIHALLSVQLCQQLSKQEVCNIMKLCMRFRTFMDSLKIQGFTQDLAI